MKLSIGELSRLASGMTAEQVEGLTDGEILSLATPRPGHPEQKGFIFNPRCFRQEEHQAQALHAFLIRLGKVKK